MKYLTFLLTAIILSSASALAQYDFNAAVPVDPTLRTGTLDNGMTYFIRHNEEPKERASFYIIQNVGAILEEDNQNGLAHFLEHMAFNGTEHFPGKGIINTLEHHGVAFGRNINAYTAQDETIYNLTNVPVGPEGLMDTCLLVLHDWSNFLLLKEDEIDSERGVISEEWRTRRNAGFRLRAKYLPVLTNGSKYGQRDVIGDYDIINNFDYDVLRKFYHDWYRTDLQAIAVVGDFDVDEMEAKIKKLFSHIPAVENEKERYYVNIEPKAETDYVLATDKEQVQSNINLYIRHESVKPEDKNINYLKQNLIESLVSSMIRGRISELLEKGTPPFITGGMGSGSLTRTCDVFSIYATAQDNKEAEAFEAILTEAERIKRYGFTSNELEREKMALLLGYENYYKRREKISHDSFCKEIQQYYLNGSPMPGIEYEYEFSKAVIPSITLEDVSNYFNNNYTEENRVIVILGPDKEGINHLSKEESLAIIEKVEKNTNITAYEDKAVNSNLVDELPIEGKIISEKELPEFDAVEWTLNNNTKVVYRFADYNKNQVSLQSYSKGGSSLYGADDLPTIEMMGNFMDMFGIGNLSASDLKKALTGKSVSLSTSVAGLSESISGGCRTEDFETLMQLAYLSFEQPRFDEEAFNAYKQRYLAYVANLQDNPNKIVGDSLSLLRSNYSPRTQLFGKEYINHVAFDKMEKIYQERFNNAADFTFFIVGDIDKEEAKTIATKYLGAISSNDTKENWRDNNVNPPSGETFKTIPVTFSDPKATVRIYLDNKMDYTPENTIGMAFIESILTLRYTEEIREKEGGTYGVSVNSSVVNMPKEKATIGIGFDTAPDKYETLIPLVFKEIEKIVKDGPSEEDIQKTKLNILKNREEGKEQNGYWMQMLVNYYVNGINSDAPENFDNIVKEMDAKQIRKLAKKFYKGADKMEVVFIPEN